MVQGTATDTRYAHPAWGRLVAVGGLLVALATSPATPAQAKEGDEPSDADRAAAQVLFDEGRTLMGEEDFEAACDKFAESMRLDRAIGTQLNLANCYEKIGKTASAWINFVEAKSRAQKAGQENRVKVAGERADALEAQLSKLTIVVPYELEGLEVRRDGELVGEAQWGIEVPADPGSHEIEASAPGKLPWTTTVVVGEEADQVEVEIAPLEDAPVEPEPGGPKPDPEEDGSGQLAAGITLGALGLVGVGIGAAFGVLAGNKNDESTSTEYCPNEPTQCTAEGVELRDEAMTFAHVSTTGFVVGGVGIAVGAILLLTLPGGEDGDDEGGDEGVEEARLDLVPWLETGNRGSAGLILRGTW